LLSLLPLIACACNDTLNVQQEYRFDLEMMPVQKRIAENETAEIRCHLLREGNYLDTRYFIRYFQPDGKGELRMDDGTLFKPNDLYPLIRELFRLYYTARSADQQVIDLYLEDSFGQVMRKTIAFDNAAADNKAGMRPFGVLSASAP